MMAASAPGIFLSLISVSYTHQMCIRDRNEAEAESGEIDSFDLGAGGLDFGGDSLDLGVDGLDSLETKIEWSNLKNVKKQEIMRFPCLFFCGIVVRYFCL